MASKLIGRTACPECGFSAAHVKQSEKCLYRYCPECGSQHHAKTERQRADLMSKTRAEGGGALPTPTEPTTREQEATPTPTASPKPTAPTAPTPTPPVAKRRGLFEI